ncbi:GHSR protein, partial [Amia calva]|nr:GHSR protein [Amia calva]
MEMVETVNDCFLTQFVREPTRESAGIDLIFSNDQDRVRGTLVREPMANCDHNMVSFETFFQKTRSKSKIMVYNFRKTNLEGMRRLWHFRPWTLGALVCKLSQFLSECCTYASVLHITALSAERYLAVCLPLRAKAQEGGECRSTQLGQSSGLLAAMMWVSSLYFLVPLCCLSVLYGLIAHRLWRRPPHRHPPLQRHTHTLRMLAVIVLVFVLCWLPFHVGRALFSSSPDSPSYYYASQYLNLVTFVLFYLSAAINPLLYNIMSQRYRRALRRLLSCHKRAPPPQSHTTFHSPAPLQSNTLHSPTLQSNTLHSPKLQSNTLQSNTAQSPTLLSDTPQSPTLQSNTLQSDTLPSNTPSLLLSDTLQSPALLSGTLQSNTLQSDTLQSPALLSGTLQSNILQSDTLPSSTPCLLLSDTLHPDALQSPALSSDTLQSNTLQSPALSSNTLPSPTLRSDTLVSPTLQSDTLPSPTLQSPALSSDTLQSDTLQSLALSLNTLPSTTLKSDTLQSLALQSPTPQWGGGGVS